MNLNSIINFHTTEELVRNLLSNIHKEIKNSTNLLYKPVIICPNANFQNYITKFMADNSSTKISMGVDLMSIEQFLKQALQPDEILMNEKILGLEILSVFQDKKGNLDGLRKIFEDNGLSIKNRFDLAFSIAYRLIKYQRELGSGWVKECKESGSSPYLEEQIGLIEEVTNSRKIRNSGIDYIYPALLPKIVEERESECFLKPIHIIGPSNLLFLHNESLSKINQDFHLYQLFPYKNPSKLNYEPYTLLKNRLNFLEHTFSISNPSYIVENKVSTTNLHSLQNKIGDESTKIEDKIDNSLQILVSPSIRRELEAVYSDIVLNMQKNEDLSPNDFLILVPNLDLYASTVRSVFSMNNLEYSESGKKIHKIMSYIITDEAAGKKSSYVLAIYDFFQLGLSGELNRRNISTLLRHTNVQIPLGLQQEDFQKISNWFDTYSFLKSLSSEEREKNTEIQRDLHSFKYFLKKIRMGIFYPSSHEDVLNSEEGVMFYPAGSPNREDLHLLEKLHRAYEHWIEWFEFTSKKLININEFLTLLEKNIKVDFTNSGEIFLYHKLKTKLLEVEREGYNLDSQELFLLVMNILEHDKDTQETILENGITISPILPVRPIPFKFIYILGLNKGAFGINPEKSPYDIFHKSSTKDGFHIIDAKESASIMLHEAIFSARTQLVLGLVAEESTEKIKEILHWFSENPEKANLLQLNQYKNLDNKEYSKKISEVLSESGVVLGGFLEFMQSLSLSIPINLIPLSRYSRYYFQKSLQLPGTFINQEIENQKTAVTNLLPLKENISIDEREYLQLFHGEEKEITYKDEKKSREIQSPVNLKKIIQFLINPLDDFLSSVSYDYEVKPDPNEEFDPMKYDIKEIFKLLLPKMKEGNQTKESLIEYYYEKKELWMAKGILPAGNWMISKEEERTSIELLFSNFSESLTANPIIKNLKMNIDGIEIYYKFTSFNHDILHFARYSKDFAEKIVTLDLFSDAIASILLSEDSTQKINMKYTCLSGGALTIEDFSILQNPSSLKEKVQKLLNEIIKEFKKGSLAYSFENIEIKKYQEGISHLSQIINFKKDYDPNPSYEKDQRERKKKILGDRNPLEFPDVETENRVRRLLTLNKQCRDLFPEIENQRRPDAKKKVAKKKAK